jgi:hypothetical protein
VAADVHLPGGSFDFMIRFALLLPLALGACGLPEPLPRASGVPVPARSSGLDAGEVRAATAADSLQGRWTIVAVNGRSVSGGLLELGGEGAGGVVTRADGGVNMESPQPSTSAYLGCNALRFSGWTRSSDKLFVGTKWSTITERGCDPAIMQVEEQTHAILRLPMTMEITSSNAMRLINEAGTLELVRKEG